MFAKILRAFKKDKSMLIDGKYRIEPAFRFKGVTYYHFADQTLAPANRQMIATVYYEEMAMRVDRDYMEKYTKAVDKILSDPRKIDLPSLMKLNMHLEERMKLLPMPDYVYKLASVIFFDINQESIFSYDFDFNAKKIERWKKSGDVLDFFLRTPFRELIPSLPSAEQNVKPFFRVAEAVDKTHRGFLSEVLSAKT